MSGGGHWNVIFTDSPAALIFGGKYNIYRLGFSAVNDNVVRAKIAWCLEFVSHLTSEELVSGFD